jgi:hypothetical protein
VWRYFLPRGSTATQLRTSRKRKDHVFTLTGTTRQRLNALGDNPLHFYLFTPFGMFRVFILCSSVCARLKTRSISERLCVSYCFWSLYYLLFAFSSTHILTFPNLLPGLLPSKSCEQYGSCHSRLTPRGNQFPS